MTTDSLPDPARRTPGEARNAFRAGARVPTAGFALGYTQANLISLPQDYAYDMLLFAQRNPKPCPVLEVTDPGSWHTALAPGADLRTDLPAYQVWKDGAVVEEPRDVRHMWREDLVTFVIGCSFSFEGALIEAGVRMRHVEEEKNISMYITNRLCRSAGRLHGPLVVTMRPIPAELVATTVVTTSMMPAIHGAPVHIGAPEALGIEELSCPDFGDSVDVRAGEIPVFWACGVTSQLAVMNSRPPVAITHAPGHMLITDARDSDYRITH